MSYVANRTAVPLEAPVTTPDDGLSEPGLAATATATANSYSVDSFVCGQILPLNDPQIFTGSCHTISAIGVGFGGAAHSSPAAAQASLARSLVFDSDCRQTSSVDLGDGIRGQLLSRPGYGNCSVKWREGAWTIEVTGMMSRWQDLARPIVSFLNANLLPPAFGFASVVIGGDSDSTNLTWVVGRDTYSTRGLAALQTFALAVAMRRYQP